MVDWKVKYVTTFKPKLEWQERLKEIALALKSASHTVFEPDIIAFETQYLTGLSSNSVLKTTEVKGVCRWVLISEFPKAVFVDVSPSEAKKAFWIKGKRAELKILSVAKALELFPYLKDKKIDDNAADAISIALAAESIWRIVK